MRKFLALMLAALCLWASPASAGMTVTSMGVVHRQATATTNVFTTNTDCPVGSLIVVEAPFLTVADTVSSVADSAGNSYTVFDNIGGTLVGLGWAYSKNTTVDLPVGGTVTVTFGGSVTTKVMALCISASNLTSPLDVSNKTDQGTAATAANNVASGTLANATEVLIGFLATANSTVTSACNGSYSANTSSINNSPSMTLCVLIVASPASVGFAPTWSDSTNYVTDLVSFQGVSVTLPSLSTTGAGA